MWTWLKWRNGEKKCNGVHKFTHLYIYIYIFSTNSKHIPFKFKQYTVRHCNKINSKRPFNSFQTNKRERTPCQHSTVDERKYFMQKASDRGIDREREWRTDAERKTLSWCSSTPSKSGTVVMYSKLMPWHILQPGNDCPNLYFTHKHTEWNAFTFLMNERRANAMLATKLYIKLSCIFSLLLMNGGSNVWHPFAHIHGLYNGFFFCFFFVQLVLFRNAASSH